MPADQTQFSEVPCPSCGRLISGATGTGEPRDGDSVLCIYCVEPAIFTTDTWGRNGLRKPTPEEQAEILVDHGDKIQFLKEYKKDNPIGFSRSEPRRTLE